MTNRAKPPGWRLHARIRLLVNLDDLSCNRRRAGTSSQNSNFSPNWICRDVVDVEVITRRGRRPAGGCGVDHRVRGIEVGVIERVEELGAELKADVFGKLEFPRQGQIRGGESGSLEDVAAGVAIRSRQRLDERGGIEILVGPTFNHRAGKVGVQGRPNRVAAVTIVRGVIRQLRSEGQAGLQGLDSAQLPTAEG